MVGVGGYEAPKAPHGSAKRCPPPKAARSAAPSDRPKIAERRRRDRLGSQESIEARINAEDPEKNFRPSIGNIDGFHVPGGPGIRVDTHLYSGYTIPQYYDSLIAKLIAYGNTREETISRLRRALTEFVIEGIKTTIPFHLKLLENKRFLEGDIHTGLVDELL